MCCLKVTKRLFLPAVLTLVVLLIFSETKKRISDSESQKIAEKSLSIKNAEHGIRLPKVEKRVANSLKKPETGRSGDNIAAPNDIWCEVRDYKDLSNDPVFDEFSSWLKIYNNMVCEEPINCQNLDHDPRKFTQLVQIGEKIAKRRGKVLGKIIRQTPKEHLNWQFLGEK